MISKRATRRSDEGRLSMLAERLLKILYIGFLYSKLCKLYKYIELRYQSSLTRFFCSTINIYNIIT